MGNLSQEDLDRVLDDISLGMELFGKIHTAWAILVEQVESIKVSGRTHNDYARSLLQKKDEDQTLLISQLYSVMFHEQKLSTIIRGIFEHEEDLRNLMKCLKENEDFISSSIRWKPKAGYLILNYYSKNKDLLRGRDLIVIYFKGELSNGVKSSSDATVNRQQNTFEEVPEQKNLSNTKINPLIEELKKEKTEKEDLKIYSRLVTEQLKRARTRERRKLVAYTDENFIDICNKHRKGTGTLNIRAISRYFGVSDQTIHNEINKRKLGWLKTSNTHGENNYKECPDCGTPTLIGTDCGKCKQIKKARAEQKRIDERRKKQS